MITITRERLEWLTQISSRDEIDDIDGDEIRELARIALDAQAVAPVYQWRERYIDSDLWDDCTKEQYEGFAKRPDVETRILYTAPPAPVVDADDNFYSWFGREWEQYYQPNNYSSSAKKHLGAIAESAWFACRAAMLQRSQPVSNRDELPLDYLQGHKDGLEWAAQLAEANHPQTGDWLYDDPIELAKAIRKGPDMPESRTEIAEQDDNFYSWFGRFWIENYQQKNYTTSAKQTLGTLAEFAYRAGRDSAIQAGNSPVTILGDKDEAI